MYSDGVVQTAVTCIPFLGKGSRAAPRFESLAGALYVNVICAPDKNDSRNVTHYAGAPGTKYSIYADLPHETGGGLGGRGGTSFSFWLTRPIPSIHALSLPEISAQAPTERITGMSDLTERASP